MVPHVSDQVEGDEQGAFDSAARMRVANDRFMNCGAGREGGVSTSAAAPEPKRLACGRLVLGGRFGKLV